MAVLKPHSTSCRLLELGRAEDGQKSHTLRLIELCSNAIPKHLPPFGIDYGNTLQPPSLANWFGTHDLGRDVASRALAGGYALGKGRKGNLDPGDSVAVVEAWKTPKAAAEDGLSDQDVSAIQAVIGAAEYRADERSPSWAGNAVVRVPNLEPDATSKKRVKAILAGLPCLSDRVSISCMVGFTAMFDDGTIAAGAGGL